MNLDPFDHERHVRRALALAEAAGERGDDPYGSVLVRDDEVVAEASNRVHTDDDVALHPELTLAREAASEHAVAERASTVLYTSTEPCPMCATGIAYADLGAVVYSVSGARVRQEFGPDGVEGIPCEEVFERLGRSVEVVGPVLQADGLVVHRTFAAD